MVFLPPPPNADKSFPLSSLLLPPTRGESDSAMQIANTGTFSYTWCCCLLPAFLPHTRQRGGSSRGKEGGTAPGNRTTWHLGKGEITPTCVAQKGTGHGRAWQRWGDRGARARTGRLHYHAMGRPVKGSRLGASLAPAVGVFLARC